MWYLLDTKRVKVISTIPKKNLKQFSFKKSLIDAWVTINPTHDKLVFKGIINIHGKKYIYSHTQKNISKPQ